MSSLFKPALHQLSLMEGLNMETQICSPNTPLPPSSPPLSMHKNSQTISKRKPKIRIIHIFAPEIIKTDAANFRELVQRLTGKPTDDDLNIKKTSKNSRKKEGRIFAPSKEMEIAMRAGFNEGFREKIKGEDEIWSGANSGGGFLGEFDGFLNYDHFPLLQNMQDHVHVYEGAGETQIN